MGPGPLHCSISLEHFEVHRDFFPQSKGCKLVGDKALTPTFPAKSRFSGLPEGLLGLASRQENT